MLTQFSRGLMHLLLPWTFYGRPSICARTHTYTCTDDKFAKSAFDACVCVCDILTMNERKLLVVCSGATKIAFSLHFGCFSMLVCRFVSIVGIFITLTPLAHSSSLPPILSLPLSFSLLKMKFYLCNIIQLSSFSDCCFSFFLFYIYIYTI